MRGGGRGTAALRLAEDRDDESAARVLAEERRALQRAGGVHGILGRPPLPNGDKYLVNTNVVDDPVYLQAPFQTAIHYKLERDTSKWDPTPCDARF